MAYIKRILWSIGLLPVSCVIAFWFMLELFTAPLKKLIRFLAKGRVKHMKLEWFDFVSKPCLYYLGMGAAPDKDLAVMLEDETEEFELYTTEINFQSFIRKDDFHCSLFPGIHFQSYRHDDGYRPDTFIAELNWLCWSIFFIKTY